MPLSLSVCTAHFFIDSRFNLAVSMLANRSGLFCAMSAFPTHLVRCKTNCRVYSYHNYHHHQHHLHHCYSCKMYRSQWSSGSMPDCVREVPGSNRAVGSCVYRTTTAINSLGHGLCAPFLQCLGQLSLLPSVGR